MPRLDTSASVTVNPMNSDLPNPEELSDEDEDLATAETGGSPAPSALNHLFVPYDSQGGLRAFMEYDATEGVIMGVIVANTVLMTIFHPNLKVSDATRDLLGHVDLGFTLFYTLEALIRVGGFGFASDSYTVGEGTEATVVTVTEYRSYMSVSWNRLDLFVVTVAWGTYVMEWIFDLSYLNITMLRALRVLRLMHAFRFLQGIRAILSSLARAVEGMGNICLLFCFFFAIYTIIGISLFAGATRTQCVSLSVASACNATDAKDAGPNMLIWGGETCDVVDCPGSMGNCESPNVCMIVGDSVRGGLAGYDNAMAALLSLFIATTGDNWQDITWIYAWSPGSSAPLSYAFFVSIQVLLTMVAMNIFVAVICGAFDEVRAEENHSAFATEERLNQTGKRVSVDSEQAGSPREQSDDGWAVPRPVGWVAPGYQSDAVERITEEPWFDASSTVLILLNVITLSLTHHGMSDDLTLTIEICDIIFTVLFDIEMAIKVIGLGWGRYWAEGFNRMDAVVNITSTLGLISFLVGSSHPVMALIKILRLTRILRVMRLMGKIQILRELLDVVLGSWVAVVNLCVFIVYCLSMFAIFGMHMMGDQSQFDDLDSFLDEGTGDPGLVPRPTFQNFLHAFTTCFLMMTGDRWKVTMYTYMQTYGLAAAFFFCSLWTLCSCVLLNLFVAVVVENFALAEDEMLKRQKLKYEASVNAPENRNFVRSIFEKLGCTAMLEREDEEHGREGKSYFLFSKDNPIRSVCIATIANPAFDIIIMLLIAFNCCMIAYEGPPGSLDDDLMDTFEVIDIVLLAVFWAEFLVRTVALGFLLTKDAYIADNWNKLDFAIISTGLLAVAASGNETMREVANICRLFRLLRPLRLLNKIEGMRHIVNALVSSAGGLLGVILLGMVFYLMFAILGINLFAGKFFKCDDLDVYGEPDCVGTYTYEAECPTPHAYPTDGKKCVYLAEPAWRIAQGYSFDNIGQALQTLFLVGTCAGWSEALYLSMDTTEVGVQPSRFANPYAALFYISFLFVCSFALVNLFVGVLIYLFGVSSGSSLQTEKQQQWTLMMLASSNYGDEDEEEEIVFPQHAVRASCYHLMVKPWFDHFITGTIIFNVLVMMANYFPEPSGWSLTLEILNWVCLVIFTGEMAIKITALGPLTYWKSHWNKLDGFVVLSSYVFAILGGSQAIKTFGRCLRVARIVLLVKRFKGLRQIFQLFFISIPAAFYIILLLFMLFFIYACLGMYLFGHTKILAGFNTMPDNRGVRTFCPNNQLGMYSGHSFPVSNGDVGCTFGNYDSRGNFRDFGSAVKLLLQLATGEDFLIIVPELMLAPPYCTEASTDPVTGDIDHGNCGSSMGFIYVATFYLLAAWLLLNMIIGVIMENFETIKASDGLKLTESDLQSFLDEWTFSTQNAKGVSQGGKLPTNRLRAFLKSLSKLASPLVPADFNTAWYADVLHALEQSYSMNFEEQQAGYTHRQVLRTLIMIEAGGHQALSIAEQVESEAQADRDRAAKVVVGVIRSWRRQREDPQLQHVARIAMTLRLRTLASRKIERVLLDGEEGEEGDVDADPAVAELE